MKIVTEHVYPPIPIRTFDWSARLDDEASPVGWGETKEKAVEDLKLILEGEQWGASSHG